MEDRVRFRMSKGVAGIIEGAIASRGQPSAKEMGYEFMMTSVGDLETIYSVQRRLDLNHFDFVMSGGLYPCFKTDDDLVRAMLLFYNLDGTGYFASRFRGNLEQRGLVDSEGKLVKDKVAKYIDSEGKLVKDKVAKYIDSEGKLIIDKAAK
jgi:hypothetical protein